MAEPRICHFHWQTGDPEEEWVEVVNGGGELVALSGLELSDFTATQEHVHIYRFPLTPEQTPLGLPPGGSATVITGHGSNG